MSDMDEYIKRSEVVGLIEDKLKRCETVHEALAFASLRTAVMGLRSASVAPRAEWISVKERLPETEGWYFVWDDVQETVKKRFFYRIPPNFPVETYPHIREYFGNVSDYKRFTHWMPLPEPPKGD